MRKQYTATEKLYILSLAEKLGNVSEACRITGISRTQFYDYKRNYDTFGAAGLENNQPVRRTHPHTSDEQTVNEILKMCLAEPGWGCLRISSELRRLGIIKSAPTVQKILNRHGMRFKENRIFKLEEKVVLNHLAPSQNQLAAIIKNNPCFKERDHESKHPGALLIQDTFFIGVFKNLGRLYLQAVVDTYSSHGFALLHPYRSPEFAVKILQYTVLPFYENRHLKVDVVRTNHNKDYTGNNLHPYRLCLLFNHIEHQMMKCPRNKVHGFMERFYHTILTEFFSVTFSRLGRYNLEEIQLALDSWLKNYNSIRSHEGYRNMGKTPSEMIKEYIELSSDHPEIRSY